MRRLLSRHSLIDGDHNERISSFSDAGWHQLLTGYFRFSFSTPGYHFNAAHQFYVSVSYPFLSFGSTRCGWVNDHCRMPLRDSHRHLSRWVMWGFMLGSLLCSIYLWQNLSSILPLMGSLLMTFASFQKRSGKLRGYTLCGSLCWLLNNVIVGSPVAVIMELAFSGSILAAWWRHSATRRCGCV